MSVSCMAVSAVVNQASRVEGRSATAVPARSSGVEWKRVLGGRFAARSRSEIGRCPEATRLARAVASAGSHARRSACCFASEVR